MLTKSKCKAASRPLPTLSISGIVLRGSAAYRNDRGPPWSRRSGRAAPQDRGDVEPLSAGARLRQDEDLVSEPSITILNPVPRENECQNDFRKALGREKDRR